MVKGFGSWKEARRQAFGEDPFSVAGKRPGVLIVHQWLGITDYEKRRATMLAELGAALRRRPESATLLLKAYDARDGGDSRRDFARHVFRFAGKDMLSVLHEALGRKDRIIRSNAARACGAIGDPTSIPLLIRALDMESGLARASIVRALGELKARDALPHLATLYVDARNDEKRRRGSGAG